MPLEILGKLEPSEIKVYEALDTMSIGRCSPIEVKEHVKTCIALSGCQVPSNDFFQFIVEFIIKNFKEFKLKELGVAFELYALGKLTVDKSISFSPKFVGDVMAAYKPIAVKVRNSIVAKKEEEPVREVTDDEIVDYCRTYWADSTSKDFRFLNVKAFEILWKRKEIRFDQERAEAIKSKVRAFYRNRIEKKEDEERLLNEDFIKEQCKKYSLMLYLNGEL